MVPRSTTRVPEFVVFKDPNERFYRVDSDRSRSTGDKWPGLAIPKWALELNGGVIDMESDEGCGSAFRRSGSGSYRDPHPAQARTRTRRDAVLRQNTLPKALDLRSPRSLATTYLPI